MDQQIDTPLDIGTESILRELIDTEIAFIGGGDLVLIGG